MKIKSERKKIILLSLAVVLFVFLNTGMIKKASAAAGIARSFGGRIIQPKAMQIQMLESSGFVCTMPGTSISIVPLGSPAGTPTDFMIPYVVVSKTGSTPTSGQFILGNYAGKMTATCILQTSSSPIVKTVILDTIKMFGSSRGVASPERATRTR